MNKIKGNLLFLAEEGEFDVIVHGCNCYHAMGGGIAAKIALHFPEAERADEMTPYGSREKLGSFSSALIEREGRKPFTIINAYTQHRVSGFRDVFEYDHFQNFLLSFESYLMSLHKEKGKIVYVGFPKIGCGLARGDESVIIPLIEDFANKVKDWAVVKLVSLEEDRT
jgi:O-acetyl-ADP-ribose deacetylase (regulator of RNase III)